MCYISLMLLTCAFCKKQFQADRRKRKYCNRSCRSKNNISYSLQNIKSFIGKDGKNAPNWHGGKMHSHSLGYVRVTVGKNKMVFEHRYVMEKHLGRPLKRSEHVHHINGDKTDNRIENLMLFPDARAHAKHHISISGHPYN